MNTITIKGLDLEKNVWEQTDDTQWVKYLNISNDKEHWFKIVDALITEDYCLFGAIDVLINTDDLHDGYYDEYLHGYYDSLEEVIETYPNSYIQILAECIAETDMFIGNANNFSIIKKYEFDNDCENVYEETYSKCDEIEKFIKENL